ncbi:permease-like cell division protein FtsX [Chitinimonas lacunae]|uniref:Cell division protein FtsX n=1 Tax=Chitinimonas lacunae TaxID=1963018 RepID=A0ABV8MUZ5_9NEIS
MKQWLLLHRMALARTVKLLGQAPFATFVNLLVIGVAVALPLGLYTVVANLGKLTDKLPVRPQLTVFLHTHASPDDIARLKKQLEGSPQVARARFVDKAEALKALEQSSGIAELLAGLEGNPLPDAFAVELKDNDPARLTTLAEQVRTDPAVETVQLDADWARRLQALVALGQEATLVVAALFGAGLLLVTANLIRMQILTRREEIEVARLMGATDGFIRRPFLYFAATQGILGSLIGLAMVALAVERLAHPVAELARLYNDRFELTLPPANILAMALLTVTLVSLAGASLSVRRHLQAIDP